MSESLKKVKTNKNIDEAFDSANSVTDQMDFSRKYHNVVGLSIKSKDQKDDAVASVETFALQRKKIRWDRKNIRHAEEILLQWKNLAQHSY